jgi:hypothetical protein
MSIDGRWGWVPGPMQVAPVYAPALVVFVGRGPGFGGNIGCSPWAREVYVPSYGVSREYVNRVNVSNTTVNTTTVTNVHNRTIVNNNTTVNNVTYVNRNISGAVTAVPQRAFLSAQPVAHVAVALNAKEVASMPVTSRATVAPTSNSRIGSSRKRGGPRLPGAFFLDPSQAFPMRGRYSICGKPPTSVSPTDRRY